MSIFKAIRMFCPICGAKTYFKITARGRRISLRCNSCGQEAIRCEKDILLVRLKRAGICLIDFHFACPHCYALHQTSGVVGDMVFAWRCQRCSKIFLFVDDETQEIPKEMAEAETFDLIEYLQRSWHLCPSHAKIAARRIKEFIFWEGKPNRTEPRLVASRHQDGQPIGEADQSVIVEALQKMRTGRASPPP